MKVQELEWKFNKIKLKKKPEYYVLAMFILIELKKKFGINKIILKVNIGGY